MQKIRKNFENDLQKFSDRKSFIALQVLHALDGIVRGTWSKIVQNV